MEVEVKAYERELQPCIWLSEMVEDIFPIHRTIDDHMDNYDGVSYIDK
jgi:hypothetical protein